jgi:hypothetical protein
VRAPQGNDRRGKEGGRVVKEGTLEILLTDEFVN